VINGLPSFQGTPLCFSFVGFGLGLKNGAFHILHAPSTHDCYKILKLSTT